MAVNTESIPPSHTNGVIEDGYDEDDKAKVRPADIDADMREMERRKRVELIMNSRLFREELERIIESQIKAGNNSAGLLQQISDMVGSRYTGASNHLFRNASCAVPINDIRGVESMGYVKGEKFLRCKLAALFRLIDLYGWTQNIYNHVTARLSQQEEHFLVNPYGLLYSEVTASSLVKVDMQGNVIESGTTNFSVNVAGFRLHAAIYSARPDLKCIVHIHTPSVIAVSSLKDGLLPICQEAAVIGDISHHSYIGIPNDPEEQDKIVRNLGPNNKVIFLTNHGALCCGATIEETFFYAYNTVNACETQLKVLPLGKDNLVFLSDEMRKSMYDAARKMPDSISPPVSNVPSAAAATEKRWRIGGLEFEALMRMLDNAGFRTGYVYRQPLIKGELPRPRNDVEVPPAVSSLGYLLEEEELYKGQWKKAFGGKGNDRIRWLNSPNVYQKVEILETGTADPKKITKWVDANNEEWVADGSPSHTSTPVKIENALQFVPKNTNPKEFKKLQQQIKENRRADKITSGPQSHILEGVSWEEAKKLQDANISGTSDQVILVGAASKGIIQREYQHNATVYKTPYAKNPFDAITDEEIENYKKDITRKQRGDSYYDEDESDALSSSLPPSGKRQNTRVNDDTEDKSLMHEMRVIQIETTTVPKASQAEVVLSDDNYDYYTEELEKFIVRIWEIKKMRPILKTIGESLRPVRSSDCVKDDDSSAAAHRPNMNEMFKQIAHELMTRFKQGSLFKQRPARPEFLPVPPTSPEFHNVSLKSASFDCSGTEITTLIELPASRGKYSRGSLESVHDFSSDPTTEDEEEPMSPENDMEGERGFLSLSSYVGHEYENPEESSEMNTSTTKTAVSDDTSADEDTVVCKQNNEEFDEEDDFSDCSLSSSLMHDDAENDEDVEWNTYESLNDVDEDYIVHKNDAKRVEECVTSFIEKIPTISRYQPELAVIYEETNTSDSKCSLKSILEETTAYTEPECERSDTPDTYVIEKEPTVEYNVYASVDKCIASTDALLEHVKNQKIDRNDSETGSSPVANCGPTLDNNGADSDAHTISDTSLISCLADSTEDLEALKNDGTCYDANDESEIVLDSGILMEDIITCSSEGDYTDMKLSSEVISTGIVSTLPPPEGRISSGSEEPEDAVWVTQIEKMFDFDVDDFCLVDLFAEPVEELSDDLGVVIDIGSDDQGHDAAELGDCADSITESADLSQDYLLVDAENDVEFSTFRPYRENIATDVRDLDNERLTESASSVDSVHTLILLNEPCADSKLLDENNLNAEVTLNVPETDTITETRDDAVTKPDSSEYLRQSCSCDQSDVHSNCEICKYIERSTETDSKATTKSRQDADFDFDVFDSVIIRILATENELPIGVDDTFIEYKNLKEVFGESFLDDSNIFAVSFENTPAIQNIAGCDDDDDENDENEDNFYSNDDKYVCHDCNMMDAAKFDSNVGTSEIIELEPSTHFDEENVSCVNDRVSSDLNVLLDRNEVMCETIVDDSMSQETPQDDDSEIKTAEFENQEVNCIDPSNVITVDDTIENGDSTKNPTPQSEVDFEPKNDDGELSGQLFDSQINNEEDFVAEENNNYLPVDDPNHGNVLVENDVVDEQSKCAEVFENDIDENDAINETESSIDLSENINDITVLEIDNEEFAECIASFENNGEVDNDGDRASENHDDESAVENNVSDDLSESSESIKSVKIINNVAAEECSESYTDVNGEHEYGSVAESKSSKSVESTENLGSVAGLKNLESTESLEERNVVGSDYDSVTVEPSKVAESEETTENIDSITSQKDSESIESLEENNIIGSDYDFVVEPSKVSTSEESTENIDENVTDQECSGSEESLENCPNVINDHKHGFEAESEPSESAESTENLDNATSQKDSESVVALEENNVVSSDSDSLDEEPSKLSQSLESTGNIDNVTSQKNSECTESLVESNVVGSDYDSVAVEPSEVSEFDESTENIDENVTNKRYSESEESLENCPNVINDHEHGSEAESEQSESAESTENLDNVTSQKDSESVEALEGTNDVSSDSDSVAEEPSKLPDSVESIKNIDYVTSQKDSESIESLEEDNGVSSDSNSVVEEPSTLSQSVELTENIDDNVTAENDANQEPSKQVVSTENIADVTEVGSNIVFGPEKIADLFETSDDVAMSESGVVFESAEPTESSVNFEDDLAAGNDVISEPEVPSEAAESDADDTCAENDFGQESSELRAQSDSSDDVAGNDVICESEVPSEATESNADYACRQKSSELHSQPDSSDDVVGNNVICEPEVPSEAAESNADDACAENDFGQELSELHEQSDSNDGDVGAANDVEGNENDVDDDENDVDGDENDVDGEENNVAGAENDIVYESSELVESVKASSENDAEPKISELPESSDNSDDGAGIKTDTFDESPESIQSVEDTDQLVTERNEVLSYPFDKVEIPKSSTNVDVAAKNIDQVPSGFVSSTENTDDVITVENNVSGDKGEFVENTETVETVEGNDIEGDDEFAEPTETDDDVVTVKNYSVDVPSMPAENETHSVESSDITTDSIDENRPESENNNFADATNNSNEEQATNSSREMGSNYVTLSDASSKPEDESGVLLDSPVKNQKTYARILEGSGKKRDLFDENTPPKSSPPVAQTKSPPLFKFKSEPNQLNNLKTSFRISRTAKRSSPSIPKSTEDGEDDTQRTNGIASATSSSTSSDEKKPKLEPDVTEYSVRLKLRIEWDNKQNSSDSTSKSSSFEDSLNCSESTSEGRRDLPNENHDRFEPVHRLTANFKNDYPKFISYEYFSPKVKISRTPRRTPSGAKRTVRKSISLESSPTGRYHRYCHLTSDFNATNKTPTPKRVSPSITTTTTTNVFQTNVKNSKNQLPRKAFQNKNTNLVTPLKTSTPVLNVAHQFAAKESSLIECLTTNTLSPIINSLEEFELIESLLTSCDK